MRLHPDRKEGRYRVEKKRRMRPEKKVKTSVRKTGTFSLAVMPTCWTVCLRVNEFPSPVAFYITGGIIGAGEQLGDHAGGEKLDGCDDKENANHQQRPLADPLRGLRA